MKARLLSVLSLLAAIGVSAPARAEPMRAREGAHLLAPGAWSGGLVAPVRVGLTRRYELSTQAFEWLLLSPNAELRTDLGNIGSWTFASTMGLSVPTMSMRLTQGYLFPTYENEGKKPGWVVVPSFGVLASSGPARAEGLLTLHFATSLGLPLGDRNATPLETYAPIDLVFAPALTGLRVRTGATYSHAIGNHVRARLLGEIAMMGSKTDVPRSPLVWHAALTGEVALGRRVRIEGGVHAYESDQRKTELVERPDGTVYRERVRSLDFFPAIDVIVTSR